MQNIISDSIITLKIHALAGKLLWVDWLIIFFGSYFEYVLIVALLLYAVFDTKRRMQYWVIIGLGVISSLISRFIVTEMIRALYPRSRPFEIFDLNTLIAHEATAGFPSGHASFYFALATIVLLYNRTLGYWFFVGAALISFSRVAAGIHFFGDIVMGFSVGIISALVVHLVYQNRFCKEKTLT